jgi:hypothetical protein
MRSAYLAGHWFYPYTAIESQSDTMTAIRLPSLQTKGNASISNIRMGLIDFAVLC